MWKKIHVIAHSMGNRVMVNSLRDLAQTSEFPAKRVIDEVILAAPDVDAEAYRSRYAAALAGLSDRVTLYASENDDALNYSKRAHGGYARAGEAGENLVVVEGVDTVDVSLLDTSLNNHAYYGEHKSVIFDIDKMIHLNSGPAEREGLREQLRGEQSYWVFEPPEPPEPP